MTLDLNAIQARANAATEGPWAANDFGYPGQDEPSSIIVHRGGFNWEAIRDGEFVASMPTWERQESDDAQFIAHAREDVPSLISLVRELQAGIPARVVLDGDPEVIEADLDALPLGAVIRSSAEAIAGQEAQVWVKEASRVSITTHIAWRGTGKQTLHPSDYLARYCAPLTVLSQPEQNGV